MYGTHPCHPIRCAAVWRSNRRCCWCGNCHPVRRSRHRPPERAAAPVCPALSGLNDPATRSRHRIIAHAASIGAPRCGAAARSLPRAAIVLAPLAARGSIRNRAEFCRAAASAPSPPLQSERGRSCSRHSLQRAAAVRLQPRALASCAARALIMIALPPLVAAAVGARSPPAAGSCAAHSPLGSALAYPTRWARSSSLPPLLHLRSVRACSFSLPLQLECVHSCSQQSCSARRPPRSLGAPCARPSDSSDTTCATVTPAASRVVGACSFVVAAVAARRSCGRHPCSALRPADSVVGHAARSHTGRFGRIVRRRLWLRHVAWLAHAASRLRRCGSCH